MSNINESKVEESSNHINPPPINPGLIGTQPNQIEDSYRPIWNAIQLLMNDMDESFRPYYEMHGFAKLYSMGCKPGPYEEIIVDIDRLMSELKRKFSTPGRKNDGLTCKQYSKYVGVVNAMIRMISLVKQYMLLRQKMPAPKLWIEIKFKNTPSVVSPETYNALRKKCTDYTTYGFAFNDYPY
jgi:hypothetical protein